MADQPHELNNLESELRALAPKASRIDRDRLMYEAGQAARGATAKPNVWIWRAAAALLLIAAIVQSLRLHFAEPSVIERIVYLPRSAEKSTPSSNHIPASNHNPANTEQSLAASTAGITSNPTVNGDNWIGQRNLALVAGVDAIAIRSSTSGDKETIQTMGEMRDALMLRNTSFSANGNDSSYEPKK